MNIEELERECFHIDDLNSPALHLPKTIIAKIKNMNKSPDLFPHKLDIEKNKIYFSLMNESLYKKSFFILSPGEGPGHLQGNLLFSTNLDSFYSYFRQKGYENKSAIIYNHGFCCSTLLTRLLEIEFKIISLKEPPLLNTLTHHLESNEENLILKEMVFNITNRTYRSSQKALWKPSQYAFDLIGHTEKLNIPSIYLYSPLREFIASCMKDKRHQWIAERANYNKIINYLDIKEEVDLSKTYILATLYWCFLAKKYIYYNSHSSNTLAVNTNNFLTEKSILKKIGSHLLLKKNMRLFKNKKIKLLLNNYAKTDDYEFNAQKRNLQLSKIIESNKKDITYSENLANKILGIEMNNLKFDNEII